MSLMFSSTTSSREWSRVKELKADLQERVRYGLANLTPLADATNGAIKNRAPGAYLDEFGEADPDERDEGINAMLRRHLIEPSLLWTIDDRVTELDESVERFLDDRLDAIVIAFRALVSGEWRAPEARSA
jgi:hypothetical protein